jgi:AcrR family transcriptional regulator
MKIKRIHKSAREREDEILTAATRVFADRGYQVADMQAIAALAGVGKGTLYRYFPSKESLFISALQRQLDGLKTVAERARDTQADPLEKLRAVMLAYLEYFAANPEFVELLVQERAEFRNQTASLYFVRAQESRPYWLAMFREIKAAYPVRDLDEEDMMDVCAELVHSAAVSNNSPFSKKPPGRQLEIIFEIYTRGIMASGDG